jgi:JAB domain-containing protein similar to deubiquitination enzymes
VRNTHRFVMEIRGPGSEVLYRQVFAPDWEPAVEGARLAGLRANGVWPEVSDPEPRLEPVWHRAAGAPMLEGFRIHMKQDGHSWSEHFATARYFAEAARTIVASQLENWSLAADARVRFAISAYEVDAVSASSALSFGTTERSQPCVVRERAFAETIAASISCGELHASDMEVVLRAGLIDDVCTLARNAGERETGGILIGHLCRSDASGDVGVEVTAHIPARHTIGDAVKLTFTSDTWTDVRAAITLRRADELLLGWWHSHPAHAWCAKCPIERQRVCQLSTGFLSADDRALHRTIFPSAFSLALVVTNSIAGLDATLFGWRGGVLEKRGFRLVAGDASSLALISGHGGRSAEGAACATSGTPSHPDSLVVPGMP